MRASKFWENQRPSVYTDDERYLGRSRLQPCSLSKNNVNITAVQKLTIFRVVSFPKLVVGTQHRVVSPIVDCNACEDIGRF